MSDPTRNAADLRAAAIREALGRASHAHLREQLAPAGQIRDWDELSPEGRALYLRREEWLVQTVLDLIDQALTEASK